MGIFSYIQIKTDKSKLQFITQFVKAMDKYGFAPTEEKNAQLSYTLLFSETGGWVTICLSDYESNNARFNKDFKRFSEQDIFNIRLNDITKAS